MSSGGGHWKSSDTAASPVNPVSTNCISKERRDAFCNENQGNKIHYSSSISSRERLNNNLWVAAFLLASQPLVRLRGEHFTWNLDITPPRLQVCCVRPPKMWNTVTDQGRHFVDAFHHYIAIFTWGIKVSLQNVWDEDKVKYGRIMCESPTNRGLIYL